MEISEKEYRKIAEEARKCPICGGRPILHMMLCMKRKADIKKMKRLV